MKQTLLILCAMLSSCSKLMPDLMHSQSVPGLTTNTTTVQTTNLDANAVLFVGAGQSNMSQQTNLKETFPNSVNLGIGGSPLTSWQKGTASYQKILDACKDRKAPCVLLFWQGEAETTDQTLADTWGSQFLVMVDNLRHDLGYDIKIVYVQLGQVIDNTNDPGMPTNYASYFPYWSTVKAQQAAVNATRPNLDMVTSNDMSPASGDGIHYTLSQYKIIQTRMGDAYAHMQ